MEKANVFYSTDNKDYDNIKDEDLIEIIKSGDKNAFEYLINKYKELVNIKVSKYFIIGAERDDIVQEGLIGLFKAIKSYKSDMKNSFKSFANMCIERQLITAIKSSNRQKHMPLNSYLSLNISAYDEEDGKSDTSLIDIFNTTLIEDPLDTITKKEYYKNIEDTIDKSLSDFEKKVLNKYINGKSYLEIAEDLDTPVKSIDNAIQRIRKKAIKGLKQE
jgi:RNA polymerase sporulation-specific sigma factor